MAEDMELRTKFALEVQSDPKFLELIQKVSAYELQAREVKVESDEDEAAITFREADMLRKVDGVAVLDARVEERVEVAYRNKNSSVTVIGSEGSAFAESVGVDILEGRMLETGDSNSAVLGYSVQERVFDDEDMLGRQIKIDGMPFRVVGILEESGQSMGGGGSDNSVYIPQKVAKTAF